MNGEKLQAIAEPINSASGVSMKAGMRYIVTKASDDGTFQTGDHISVNTAGSINCIEAQGWIDACDVAEASAGMAVDIDRKWIARQKAKMVAALAALDAY